MPLTLKVLCAFSILAEAKVIKNVKIVKVYFIRKRDFGLC